MKILVIGLSGASPEILLGDDRLENLRHLMNLGCYGQLEGVLPSSTIPSWSCMSTSQDPGTLGVYGRSHGIDHRHGTPGSAQARSIGAPAIWDEVARRGGRSVLIGMPSGDSPPTLDGIPVVCFPTENTKGTVFASPPEIAQEIESLVSDYPVNVENGPIEDRARLRDVIVSMSRAQFAVARHFLQTRAWEYFQFLEVGLDRIQRGFWRDHDSGHRLHEPDSPYREVVRDYYRHLDAEIGGLIELLTDDTILLIVSDHGARRVDGGFCVNEWLFRNGFLVLNQDPGCVTSFHELDVNWERTLAWSAGGDFAQIFLNVKGRESQGAIDQAAYEAVRDALKSRLESTTDTEGRSLGMRVFKPEELYREVRNLAPDLIVEFEDRGCQAIDGVGYSSIHLRGNETELDDCTVTRQGVFILAGQQIPLQSPLIGARLLDIAPTLLELGGYPIPPSMQGHSLLSGTVVSERVNSTEADDDHLIRERLSGLGYIS